MKNKSVFAVVLFCVQCVVMLCSCSPKEKMVMPVTANFAADIKIEYDNLTCDGRVEFVNMGDFTVNITSPETLDGLKIDVNADDVKIEYKGLDCSELYDFSAISLFSSAVTDLEFDTNFKYNDGRFVSDDCSIAIDDKGFITEIDFEKIELKINLSNHEVI